MAAEWGWQWPYDSTGAGCGCCAGTGPGSNICFIVAGSTGPVITALDSTGSVVWTYTPSHTIYGITRDTDNNVYLGYQNGITKLDPNGNFLQDFNFTILQGFTLSGNSQQSNEYSTLKYLNGFLYLNHGPDANFDVLKKFDLTFTQIQTYGKSNFASTYGWSSVFNCPIQPGKLAVVAASGLGTGTGDEAVIYWDSLTQINGRDTNKILESTGQSIWAHGTAGCFQDMNGGTTSTYTTGTPAGFAFNPNIGVDGYVAIPSTPNFGTFYTGGNNFAGNPWETGSADFCLTSINTTSFKVGKIPHLIVAANNQLIGNSLHQIPISQKSIADVNYDDGGDRLFIRQDVTTPIIASVCYAGSFFLWSYWSSGFPGGNVSGDHNWRVKRAAVDIHCGEQNNSWNFVAAPGVVKADSTGATLTIRNYIEAGAGSGGGANPEFNFPNQSVNNVLTNLTYSPSCNLVVGNWVGGNTLYCISPVDLSTQWTHVLGPITAIYGSGNESY